MLTTVFQGLCWFSLGIPFLVMGVAMRVGRFKRWYLHTQLIPYMPPSSMYALFPIGFSFALPPAMLSIMFLLPIDGQTRLDLAMIVWVVCLLLALVFPIWQPNFLKPKWLQSLESQYPPDVITYFRQEWSKMDRDEWVRKIGTEKGMEDLIRMVTE